jgi:hypothetical protein
VAAIAPHVMHSVDFDGGTKDVVVRISERPTLDDTAWETSEIDEATSFYVTAAAWQEGLRRVYVAGIENDDQDVIERWAYAPRSGGYFVQRTTGPVQPIGTAMPEYAAQESLGGATYESLPTRLSPATRVRVYRGTSIGHIRSMVVEPEGRFLLVLTYPDRALYRIDLTQSGYPRTLLHSVGTLPHLQSATTLRVREHSTDGRAYSLFEIYGSFLPSGYSVTLLFDPENDGILSAPVTLTAPEWIAAGYESDAAWSEYENLGVVHNW